MLLLLVRLGLSHYYIFQRWEIFNRIQAEIKRAVATPEMKTKLDELGLIGVASTPVEFARFLQDDLALQQRIAKKAGIEPQ